LNTPLLIVSIDGRFLVTFLLLLSKSDTVARSLNFNRKPLNTYDISFLKFLSPKLCRTISVWLSYFAVAKKLANSASIALVLSPLEQFRGRDENNKRHQTNNYKVYHCTNEIAVNHYRVKPIDYVEQWQNMREGL
jgi:hypothetical protein